MVNTVSPTLLLREVEVEGRRVDVVCGAGRVTGIAEPSGHHRADVVIDGGGGTLLPGLHDHHIHLLATAAAHHSVDLSGPAVHDATTLGAALRASGGPGRWVRAIGYHESVAGPLDRWVLDRLLDDRPVRVQHRTGALWVLNSAAVHAAGLDGVDLDGVDLDGLDRDGSGRPTGRLWRLDEWLRSRIPTEPPDLAPVGTILGRVGITGVTDATPTADPGAIDQIARAAAAGDLPQRIVVMGGLDLPPDRAPELSRGPVKLLLHDHDLPSGSELVERIRAARTLGRAVAIHSVTLESLVLSMSALRTAGPIPGDRVEHAAVVLPELLPDLAELGATVVTSPAMVLGRGDRYLADVDPTELPHLWRCASLLDAGIAVAGGSDAPFGPLDPWLAIAAAASRTTGSGKPLGDHERIPARRALGLFLGPLHDPGGPERRIVVGADADLCLLDRPLAAALAAPSSDRVVATVLAGAVAFQA